MRQSPHAPDVPPPPPEAAVGDADPASTEAVNGDATGGTNGDANELGRLADEHGDAIYRVAFSITRDGALAEDATQDTLLKAWSNLAKFRGESSERTWVLRIAHNTCISLLRKRRDHVVETQDVSDAIDRNAVGRSDSGSPEKATTDRLFREHFEKALFELDELTRSILVLRELEQLGYEEIAAALEVPLPTVKTRLLRGRRRLATVLEEWR